VLTVNTLLVSKGLSLLSLVPLNDQTVTERECRSSVRSATKCQSSPARPTTGYNVQLIAVEQRSRQSGLNVLYGLGLKLILGLELFRRLTEIVSTPLH